MIKEITRNTRYHRNSNTKQLKTKTSISLYTMPNMYSPHHTSRNTKPSSTSPKKLTTINTSISKAIKPTHISNQTSLLSTKDTLPHQRKHHFIKRTIHPKSTKVSPVKTAKPLKHKSKTKNNVLLFDPINKYDNMLLLKQIHEKINIPNQKQFNEKNIISLNYAKRIRSLSNHLSMVNNELSFIKEQNVTMEKESKLKKLDTKAWQIENGFMQYEVNKLKKEITVMQNEVFRLNKEKIILINNAESEEYIMKDMKKEIKWYKENINEMENDLKNMKSAFLLMHKQIKQMKFELTKHKIQNDTIGEELLYLLSKYGK
jgi:hypothetical protein